MLHLFDVGTCNDLQHDYEDVNWFWKIRHCSILCWDVYIQSTLDENHGDSLWNVTGRGMQQEEWGASVGAHPRRPEWSLRWVSAGFRPGKKTTCALCSLVLNWTLAASGPASLVLEPVPAPLTAGIVLNLEKPFQKPDPSLFHQVFVLYAIWCPLKISVLLFEICYWSPNMTQELDSWSDCPRARTFNPKLLHCSAAGTSGYFTGQLPGVDASLCECDQGRSQWNSPGLNENNYFPLV